MERLTMTRGDTRQLEVTILDPDGTAWTDPGGATIAVTGKLRRSDTDDNAIFTKTSGDGVTLAANVATVTLEPEDTDTLGNGNSAVTVYCDVQITDADGPKTPTQFLLIVEPDVTRTP
jgi:hypothetical protein